VQQTHPVAAYFRSADSITFITTDGNTTTTTLGWLAEQTAINAHKRGKNMFPCEDDPKKASHD